MATIATTRAETTDAANGELIDLRMIGAIFRRRLPIFLIVAGIVLALAVTLVLILPNKYAATANLLLDRQKMDVVEANPALSDLPEDSASVDTEVQILRSPSLLLSVARDLNLASSPEFKTAMGNSWSDFAAISGKKTASDDVDSRIVDYLEKTLEIDRRGLTYVISVTATTQNPDLSARIANGVSQAYINRQVAMKRDAAVKAQQYLDSRLSGLGAEVQSREARAEAARAAAGLPLANNQESYDQNVILDTSRNLVDLESDLAQKRGQLATALSARNNPAALPAVIESQVIRDLKARRAQAIAERADISGRYGPNHPETARIAEELKQLDQQIANEMRAIISSLEQQVKTAQSRVTAVRSQLAGQRSRAVANSRNTAQVQQIDREASASRTVYEDFLKRSKETAQTEDLATPDAVLVNRAIAPNDPVSPNRPVLLLAGLAGALGLGFLSIIGSELLDVKISTPQQIRSIAGAEKIVSIPRVKAPRGIDSHSQLVFEKPHSLFAEAFRDLASHVEQLRKSEVSAPGAVKKPFILLVSAALPHEGKTTSACALALTLAQSGHRVLLVDGDVRRPQVLPALGLANEQVLMNAEDFLSGNKSASSLLRSSGHEGLDLLPLSGFGNDVFHDDRFVAAINAMGTSYDYVIYDTPPVLALQDAKRVSLTADMRILVTRWRKTSRYAVKAAVKAFDEVPVTHTAVVLNAVDISAQSLYSRDDTLAFYKQYESYYAN